MSTVYPGLPLFRQAVFQHPDWEPFAQSIRSADRSLEKEQARSVLLQQVLPHVDAAVYSSRDALLHQGAKLDDFVRSELAGIKATVNAMASGQIQFRMTGIGSFGAVQPMAAPLQSIDQVSFTLFTPSK